ncbi:very short patch repair endonuclease [Longibaculum muris]|uniref:very short patch repair endonuclease n=1 Tax=Longibaculum muris TaxID=1796628 RepID=UPI0022E775DD|nr:very short patch repair endonuclease [Longibaculum muris]
MKDNVRSKIMSRIKGKDTSIELKVRKYLYHHGFRYKKNDKSLPGTPDIVITKYKVAIFINGCFWHHHHNCKYAVYPKTRKEYWIPKIEKNVDNDIKHYQQLEELDYRVIVVWECEINEIFEYRMEQLIEEIKNPNYS